MIEVLKQALEALEIYWGKAEHRRTCEDERQAESAIASLRQAIREHAMYEVQRLGQEIEQEPVAWMKPDVLCDRACMYLCTKGFTQFPECATTHPLQRTEPFLKFRECEDSQAGTATPPQRTEPKVCCQQYDTCLEPCTPRGMHLAQRTWVGLTDEERDAIEAATLDLHGVPKFFATAIEAKLKEKNND